MPATVVVGGQYGSEGKGKVAACFARDLNASAVVRCGGSNSGHTVYDDDGQKFVFRHLPTACLQSSVTSVLAAGSYLDVEILMQEIRRAGIRGPSLCIDPHAVIITEDHKRRELGSGLTRRIGSTGSGTGAAVVQRLQRSRDTVFAKDIPQLSPFIGDSKALIHEHLDREKRIIVEGTQGFGLSVLHSNEYPYVTTRDTTAAGFISECGISPLQVDDVALVIRSFPIRVAGDSGPLKNEIDWATIASEAGMDDCQEYTSVTNQLRRVARFDADVVRDAIKANRPTRIVLNHLDYVKEEDRNRLVQRVADAIGARVDWIGLSPTDIVDPSVIAHVASRVA